MGSFEAYERGVHLANRIVCSVSSESMICVNSRESCYIMCCVKLRKRCHTVGPDPHVSGSPNGDSAFPLRGTFGKVREGFYSLTVPLAETRLAMARSEVFADLRVRVGIGSRGLGDHLSSEAQKYCTSLDCCNL